MCYGGDSMYFFIHVNDKLTHFTCCQYYRFNIKMSDNNKFIGYVKKPVNKSWRYQFKIKIKQEIFVFMYCIS